MSNIQIGDNPDSFYEVAKLYSERCDFITAEGYFKKSSKLSLEAKDFSNFLKCQNALLRIYAEMERHEDIDNVKEEIQNIVLKEKISLNAKTYYCLGLCASYKGQQKTALEYLEKSLAVALANDDKENICYAIHGIANVYYTLDRYEDALKEIYNLQVFFQVLPLDEMKLSSQIVNGHILRQLGKHDQALEIFWKCYEELRGQKNLYIFICILFAMGKTYYEAGNLELAKMYLLLAKKSSDPENLKNSSKKIDLVLAKMGETADVDRDLIFDSVNKLVIEKKIGKVDFKNQFILLDLLKMFLKTPGEVYSKEAIVEKIWKQSYDPRVHDNKLYVTIKRLRKMIEPDFDKPKYIFRAKNGYYMNKNARVVQQK